MSDILRNYIQKFIDLTLDDWDILSHSIKTVSIKKKQNILEIGDVCKHITFVVSGSFRVFEISDSGKEISTFFSLDETFVTNYWSLLTEEPSIQTIQAIEDSVVIKIPYGVIQKGYDISKNWERFGRIMAEQVFMEEMKRRNELQYRSPEEKYNYIEKAYPDWILRIPQQYIASYIGIASESLSRIRKRKMDSFS